jgi:hypothetical protein
MQRPRHAPKRRTGTMGAAVMAAALWASAGSAQTPYRTANTNSSVIPRETGLATFDVVQLRIGATWLKELGNECVGRECAFSGFGVSIFGSGFARADARQVFSDLGFVPGFDVGGRLNYLHDGGEGRYFGAYLGPSLSLIRLKVFDLDTVAETITNSETNQLNFSASAGFNVALGPATIFGLGGEIRREHDSPGPNRTSEICAPARLQSGTGAIITTTVCEQRVPAPLRDLTAGTARGDVLIKLVKLGSHRNIPVLSVLAASSVDFWEDFEPQTNFALGPVIAPARFEGHIFAALTAEITDAFNSNGQSPDFSDKFGVRLTVSVPFPVFKAAGPTAQ